MAAVSQATAKTASGTAAERHIHGQGTPERSWRAWDGLDLLPPLSLDALAPAPSRIVVVAPHPDDEVLGCGGVLAQLARERRDVLVVGITDGGASYPESPRWPAGLLASTRREERVAGLRRLGLLGAPLSLDIPDGHVSEREVPLAAVLRDLLRPDDVVITTWRRDGHPDHEATGRAAAAAAAARGARCWEMPIWTWHWAHPADARVPWHHLRRLPLDARMLARKRHAIAAHASQLETIVQEARAAVLPDWALVRLLRPFETFIPSEEAA